MHPPGKARCPRHDPLVRPLRTRPAGLPQQGVATPVARPAAAHLTEGPSRARIQRRSGPLGSALTPAGGRRRGLGGGRGRDAVSRGAGPAPGSSNGALPAAPGACRGPAPFPCAPGRGPVGGAPEPGLLATAKQGQVQTDRELASGGWVWWGFRSQRREPQLFHKLTAAGRPQSSGGCHPAPPSLKASYGVLGAVAGDSGSGISEDSGRAGHLCNGVTWTCPRSCPESPGSD